jgi:hypothetical protein
MIVTWCCNRNVLTSISLFVMRIAAFIEELMRRITQASIVRDGGTTVESDDISEALDDMLFAGGKLNVKLLGGARETLDG